MDDIFGSATKAKSHEEWRSRHDKPKIPAGHVAIDKPRPRTYYNHYSNEASQGALICETPRFPKSYNPKTHELHSAYSDRISSWDRDRYDAACEIAGGGCQSWSSSLHGKDLRQFATVALDLKSEPIAVRVVHYFNVSTGYSCPVVMAICKKPKEPQ